ncbi:MAG: T9SS C-terminal target domain-containing protein, partial [Bacteroidota bacterium]
MRILPLLFSTFLFSCHFGKTCFAQPGCTDPQALNFNNLASENDGSCTYPATSFSPIQLSLLPAELDECSGLLFFNDNLWTHEDGGAADKLFILDSLDGDLLQTITLPGVDNLDWEDLAQDDQHFYIGDFGNNDGNRTDLRILKYKKADLLAGSPTPEIIEFSFSDQTDFIAAPNANDFDCEAFFFWQDSLHLFSKNWLNFKTRHYVLSTTPGEHVAQLRDSLFVQGQITAADVSPDGKAILLGYNTATSETFLWLLFDFPGSQFFKANKRKISLGSAISNSQVEGICFRNETYGY